MARRRYGGGGSGRRYANMSEVCGGANIQAHHEHVQINMYIHNIYAYMSVESKKLQHKVVANDEVDIYVKRNFKRWNECDKFDKILLKMV